MRIQLVRLQDHVRHEAVATAGHRLNQALAAARLVQRLAQREDRDGQIVRFDRAVTPNLLQQLLLGEHAIAAFDQGRQEVERPPAQTDCNTV